MQYWKTIGVTAVVGLAVFGTNLQTVSAQEGGDETEETATENKSTSKSESDSDLPFRATDPVAEVGEATIEAEEFNELVEKKYGSSQRPLSRQMAEKFKSKMLDQIVEKHLVGRELEDAEIEVSEEDVEEEFSSFKERFRSEKAYQNFLEFRNLTEDELNERFRRSLRVRELLKRNRNVKVSDEDVKTYYEEHPDEFETDEQVKASHILIKTEQGAADEQIEKARKRAEKLAKKARKDGTDFADLAREKSEGPSARKGGDLGYFTPDRMVEAFSEKAFSMENGEISDPVKTRFGFHVIKRTGHKEASTTPFEEAKVEIVETLERKKMSEAMQAYLEELKSEVEIKKMPDNIEVTAKETNGGGLGGDSKEMKELKKKLRKKMDDKGSKSNDGETD